MFIEGGMKNITIANMSDQTHIYANDVLFYAKEMVEKEEVTMDQALKCFEIGFKEQWLDLHRARYADQSNAELERCGIEHDKIYRYEE